MTADVLRRAADLMRERANKATVSPWVVNGTRVDAHMIKAIADCYDEPRASRSDAEHIASWHPAVALAVADWLDDLANDVEAQAAEGYDIGPRHPALAVARAYLGDDA